MRENESEKEKENKTETSSAQHGKEFTCFAVETWDIAHWN